MGVVLFTFLAYDNDDGVFGADLFFVAFLEKTMPTTTSTSPCLPNEGEEDSAESSSRCRRGSDGASRRRPPLYTFPQARRMARSYGFATRQEFLDYDCPGAYALPKHPQDVWSTEWQGWDDWLGVSPPFAEARTLARQLHLSSAEAYLEWFEKIKPQTIRDNDPTSRLPYRPDLVYKEQGWQDWEDWLG